MGRDDAETMSPMVEFYRRQNVLLTGATGFLGKATLEKLLRTCRPNTIYLLVRPYRNKSPQERVEALLQDPVFDRARREREELGRSVMAVEGDVSREGLGLSDQSARLLLETTTLVLHGAASVRFDENIKSAVETNLRGTRELLRLCARMPALQSVTYISTAYSYCVYKEIEEKFYKPPLEGEALIKLCQSAPVDQLTSLTPALLGGWPNTYSFTKALAERVLQTEATHLPAALFRPSIVVGAREEPVRGWIDNLYGPTGVLVGAGAGLMRCLCADRTCTADLLPVDVAVNGMLAVAYRTALNREEADIKVYNLCSSNESPVTWGEFLQTCMKFGRRYPSIKSLYYYTFTLTSNRFIFFLATLLFHLLPALFCDMFLSLFGNKLRLMKIYSKIHKFSTVIGYFSCSSWRFRNSNMMQLLSNMSAEDKRLFDFDLRGHDWVQFFRHNIPAIRLYIFKDPIETVPRARRKLLWLHVLHRVVQLLILLAVFFSFRLVYGLTGRGQQTGLPIVPLPQQ